MLAEDIAASDPPGFHDRYGHKQAELASRIPITQRKQMKGKVKERWGKLTDDDLTAISGRRDQLEGKIQKLVRLR